MNDFEMIQVQIQLLALAITCLSIGNIQNYFIIKDLKEKIKKIENEKH